MSAPGLDELVGDRYRLRARIAGGGMGEVWRAEDTVLGRTVAVKTLRSEHVDDEEFRARFRVEARCAGRLTCPGIATVLDYGEQPGRAWLVLELVEGEALSALLHREGRLSPARTLDVVAQAAEALGTAHAAGVVHRDVKPGNLLVRPDGVVKITDFGIASAVDAAPITRTGTMVGTASYLSPEQAGGFPATGASDLYALGVLAYECLAGTRPFPGENAVAVALAHLRQEPPPLPEDVPGPVAALVRELLAKEPTGRPASGQELAVRARTLRDGLPATDASGGPGLVERGDGGGQVLPAPGVAPPPQVRSGHAPPPQTQVLAAPSGQLPADRPGPVRRRLPLRPLALAAVLLLLVGAAVLTLRWPSGVEAEPAAVESVAALADVDVDVDALVGQPFDTVAAALTAAGLVVAADPGGQGAPPGTVTAVEPGGAVPSGTTVTVTHVPAAPAPAPAPAPPAPAPPGPDPAAGSGADSGKPAKGAKPDRPAKGNGRGKGRP